MCQSPGSSLYLWRTTHLPWWESWKESRQQGKLTQFTQVAVSKGHTVSTDPIRVLYFTALTPCSFLFSCFFNSLFSAHFSTAVMVVSRASHFPPHRAVSSCIDQAYLPYCLFLLSCNVYARLRKHNTLHINGQTRMKHILRTSGGNGLFVECSIWLKEGNDKQGRSREKQILAC